MSPLPGFQCSLHSKPHGPQNTSNYGISFTSWPSVGLPNSREWFSVSLPNALTEAPVLLTFQS